MQRIGRFARYWEMVGNSGRFRRALELLLDSAPYARFMRFSDWLYSTARKTHEMALERLYEHVHRFLTEELGIAHEIASQALLGDYDASGARGRLSFMPERGSRVQTTREPKAKTALRQARHLLA
jgi:hypothetical protein